jgi:hypothetical protein
MHYKRLELSKCIVILNTVIDLRNGKKELNSVCVPGNIKIASLTTI